jgi:LuxR family maltose regulon positive regulatory protein
MERTRKESRRKGEQISIAKIARPKIRGVFPRNRLFRLLDECADHKATWLSASAGSGKTTLVASYIAEKKIPCIWYQVDEGDADIATFFYYMNLAAKRAVPRKRIDLPLLAPEYLQGIPTFTLRYFENLYGTLDRPFLVVFDNYQEAALNSSFHDVVCQGVAGLPEGVRIMVLSRKDPPAQFVRLRANNELFVIEAHQIWFTLEESRSLARQRGPTILDDDAVVKLHEGTQGWAAGLVLAMESARLQGIDHRVLPGLASEEMFDYFAREIFNKNDPVTQEVLLKTAFLPKTNGAMAVGVTGNNHATEILSRLCRDNFFTQRDGQSDPFYQYHPLFREFLLSYARKTMTSDEVAHVQRKSAQLLEQSGDISAAMDILFQVTDWSEAARLVITHAPSFASYGRSKAIEEWLDRFPREMVATSSWLLYWRGVSSMSRNPVESRAFFENAFRLFEDGRDDRGMLLAWAGVVDSILYGLDNFALADKWIGWLDDRLERDPSFPSARVEAFVVVSMAGAIFWRSPYRADAKEWFDRAVQVATKAHDIGPQIRALSRIIVWSVWMGDFSHMVEAALQAEALANSPAALPSSVLSWKYAEAMMNLTLSTGHEKALATVNEGLEISRKSGVHILDEMLLVFGIWECFTAGDQATARLYLDRLAATGPGFAPDMMYRGLSAWHSFIQGDMGRAVALTLSALEMSFSYGIIFAQMLACHLAAEILQGAGRYDEAFDVLRRLKGLIPNLGEGSLFGYLCCLDEAQLMFDTQRDNEALDALRRAMAIGKARGYKTFLFHWQPRILARLCAKALEHDIETQYVQDLIGSLCLFPDPPPFHIENWPWPVRVFTLGPFRMEKEGQPVSFSGKVQKKPLALLKTLISLGGKDVGQKQIADLLWPEAEGDAAQVAFRTTLSRLRQLVGEKTVTTHAGTVSLDPSQCWVDAFALDHLLHDTGPKEDSDEVVSMAERVFGLYRGHFLDGDLEGMEPVFLRDRLRNGFLRVVARSCDYLERGGQWEKAAHVCERALALDSCAEECYQHLMMCHRHMGSDAKAIEVYRRCRSALASELGVRPSPKTEAIRESLL